MTNTEAPISATTIDGAFVVAGPVEIIRAAIRNQTPLTITAGRPSGDRVWLRGRQVYGVGTDAITMQYIARTITHPVHGEIAAAWIDETRLTDAPVTAAAYARRHHARHAEPAEPAERTESGPAAAARAAGREHGVHGEIWD